MNQHAMETLYNIDNKDQYSYLKGENFYRDILILLNQFYYFDLSSLYFCYILFHLVIYLFLFHLRFMVMLL